MSFMSTMIGTAERVPLPDIIIRAAIHQLCSRTAMRLAVSTAAADAAFAREMAARAIAEHADAANAQHYEVPAAFFASVLGPNRKYSSCFYKSEASTLQEAEEEALRQTVEHADLLDGQSILELGCGWGSLSLFMARQFPNAQIVAVSNSHSQRDHILSEAAKAGFSQPSCRHEGHERVRSECAVRPRRVRRDVRAHDELAPPDRAGALMAETRRALLHAHLHPSHRLLSVRPRQCRGLHRPAFLTGGVMPSHHLIWQYADLFEVEKEWRWSGTHYRRTAEDWLKNFDAHRDEIERVLRDVYGEDAPLWMRRWRWFFLATAGLFGYADGQEWGVSHYRMRAV
jgi:cyclopropane-fatty-acyl-phospholipid synthase